MSSLRRRILPLGIVVGAIVVAVVLVRMRPTPPRTPPPSRVPVVGTEMARGVEGSLTVQGSGTVRPRAQIDLAPQVAGQIAWVSPSLVSGARIRAGEPLIRVDSADYVNRVRQARAQVAQDEVAVLEAEEEARIAQAEFAQFQERLERRGGSRSEVTSAVEASRLTLRGPQLEAARAALARSEAQLADAELALARTVIRAPFDGVVRTESADVGGYANAGQPLAQLYSTEEVEILIPLSDRDAALLPGLWDLRAGQASRSLPARVLASFGDGRFAWEGYVDRAEASLDEASRTIDVVVRVPDPFRPGRPVGGASPGAPSMNGGGDPAASPAPEAPPLLVGQFVDVEMTGRSGRYVSVPRRAVRPGDEVWVVEEGRIRIVPVRVLQQREGLAFVSGDLAPGDPVVVEGIGVATEGMEVRLRSEMNREEGGTP